MVRILLAEDNPGDVLLTKRALKQHRLLHEMDVVMDGEEALRYVAYMGSPGHAPCPDILLLDLNLPKVDGSRVLTEFRKRPECAHTPVIVVSSSDAKRDRDLLSELGVSRYFRKPSDYDAYMRLGALVREVVEEATAGS